MESYFLPDFFLDLKMKNMPEVISGGQLICEQISRLNRHCLYGMRIKKKHIA